MELFFAAASVEHEGNLASDYLKFFHIVFAIIFIGGTMIATAVGVRASRSKDLKEVASLLALDNIAEKFLIYPGVILTGLFGWFTAWQQGHALTGTGWLIAAYFAVGFGLIVSYLVLSKNGQKLRSLVAEASKEGKMTQPLATALASKVPVMVGNFLTLLVVFVLVVMVFKPF